MFESPVFCDNWPSFSRRTQRQKESYVVDELVRLDREGRPLLLTVLQQQDLDLQQIALQVLRANGVGYGADDATGFGAPRLRPRNAWRLRLVEGEEPPRTDPQGRVLPDKLRGKVLVAKVGNLGGEMPAASAPVESIGEHSAQTRSNRVHTGRSLYRLQQVHRDAREYTFDEAVAILRQWGVGVAQRRYRRPEHWQHGMPYSPDSNPRDRGQCNWLVEEVPLPSMPGFEPDDDGFGGRRSESHASPAAPVAPADEDFGGSAGDTGDGSQPSRRTRGRGARDGDARSDARSDARGDARSDVAGG